ncbi:SEL1-like repeat protein [Aureispira anguillae]|nr:hypothetical protein [Aureispira anguillae]
MQTQLGLFSFLLILFCTACEAPKSYSLEELEQNHHNTLALPVKPNFDAEQYKTMFQVFQEMNQQQILEQLSATDLTLRHASFGFYYLANTYAANQDRENALKYHRIAAEQYINPQSLLKLAEFNFHVTKDYAKAYEYLHQSLEIKVEITENNRSHPLSKNGKDKTQYILQELEKSGENKQFDKAKIREKLKKELPALLETYRTIYGLGPRADS